MSSAAFTYSASSTPSTNWSNASRALAVNSCIAWMDSCFKLLSLLYREFCFRII